MDIKNLKDLAKIATLCRKKGIETIKITPESVEFKLKDQAPKITRNSKQEESAVDTTDEQAFSAEEKLFWSSTTPDLPAGN